MLLITKHTCRQCLFIFGVGHAIIDVPNFVAGALTEEEMTHVYAEGGWSFQFQSIAKHWTDELDVLTSIAWEALLHPFDTASKSALEVRVTRSFAEDALPNSFMDVKRPWRKSSETKNEGVSFEARHTSIAFSGIAMIACGVVLMIFGCLCLWYGKSHAEDPMIVGTAVRMYDIEDEPSTSHQTTPQSDQRGSKTGKGPPMAFYSGEGGTGCYLDGDEGEEVEALLLRGVQRVSELPSPSCSSAEPSPVAESERVDAHQPSKAIVISLPESMRAAKNETSFEKDSSRTPPRKKKKNKLRKEDKNYNSGILYLS
ncbi:unnamed protein product [Amoebophrya sp. A25]|nr:unnamed protein product [Amoebophrya sp. A25]|eukprot:GSA25T00011339001.1